MTVEINGLKFPFEDFFQKHSQNVLMYGQGSRNLALSQLTQKRTVIDIGAHVGISVHCWAPVFEKVIAFEPMVDHYECLKENTEKFSNVEIHNCAISNESRMLRGMYRSLKNSGSFQLLTDDWEPNPRKSSKIYQIPSRRLDEFEFTEVDLIKIDVEGWELEVLRGAKETISNNKPILLVEYTGGNDRKSLRTYNDEEYHQLIHELGYRAVNDFVAGTDVIYAPLK